MSVAARLAAFSVALAALFAVGALAGAAIDPDAPGSGSAPATHGAKPAGSGHAADAGDHAAVDGVRGLTVASHGVRLVVDEPRRDARADAPLAFRIVDEAGRPVRDLQTTHERQMHLIVVRRDLTGFQHLHPVVDAAGTWSTPLTLGEPGSYRVFADFMRHGQAITLAGDLLASGNARLHALPRSTQTTATDGGLTVSRPTARAAVAERETTLAFTATGARGPARLEPYLGAGWHLVALREGDLAFLHVHPTTDTAAARSAGRVAFQTTFPTAGRYRLFLQVKVAGTVQTAAFTQEVK